MKKALKVFGFICIMTALLYAANTVLTGVALKNSTVDSTTIGATTPSSGVLTTLQINSGIAHGGLGFQHVRTASCTTGAVTNASCNTTVTWPSTWADTNYTAECFADGTSSGTGINVTNSTTKSTTQLVVGIVNCCGSATATSTTLDCVGVHD